MKYTAKLLFIIWLFLGCDKETTNKLIVTDFISSVDQQFEAGKPNFKDLFSIKIIDYQNSRTFVIPFHNARRKTILLPNGSVKEQNITYDTTYVYCMVEKGNKVGLRYDSLKASSFQKFDVDSLLNRINISEGHLKANAVAEGSLIYSLMDEKNGKLIAQKFVAKKDATIDSTYRYFSPIMGDLDFSIAPGVDKKYQSKVVKIVNIRISNISKVKNTYVTEIRPGKLKDSTAMMQLIERFRNDIKINNK